MLMESSVVFWSIAAKQQKNKQQTLPVQCSRSLWKPWDAKLNWKDVIHVLKVRLGQGVR